MKHVNEINTETKEGKVLIATLAALSGEGEFTSQHPDEILREMAKRADKIFD